MKTTKTIPTFKDENEEREFWENNETLDYFDALKVKANSMDVPYQSLIKILLQDGLVGKRA